MGAHQGLEQVGMYSHENEVEMSRRYRKDHDLMGFEAEDLLSPFDVLKEADIWQYRYPDDFDINQIGVRGVYLGNYIRWDSKTQHEKMIKMFDYKTSEFKKTFDTYDYVDCFNYMNIHDQLKLYKHGYSKVTDHATREIRFGRLDRKEGIKLVCYYERKMPIYLDLFCEWLNMDKTGLNFLLDQHKNKRYWERVDFFRWKFKGLSSLLKKEITKEIVSASGSKISFIQNASLLLDKNKKYITFGKGI